ncbi:hypothetical protein QQY24_18415 [Streptomyces sp. TG1A-8]|uniref:hypothetical protein n=1 Tax=Streptomyces sp. TG1A-8 TaxID=3051385 RepID=UPI00265BB767|nr:hypothetical protein [Streptomyces sp. TG1A-8]MDO0927291.1 hypothetical protein [Streptomyces sp. TG1A-8]
MRKKTRPVRSLIDSRIVPYTVLREPERTPSCELIILHHRSGPRLYYLDEHPLDRPAAGVLWERVEFNPVDASGMPTGNPDGAHVHAYRQVMTMQALRCQVCTEPARTPLGYVYLAGPNSHSPTGSAVLVDQPPVCALHVRVAAEFWPHLADSPKAFLAQSAPIYGVHGTVYGLSEDTQKVCVVAKPDHALPLSHRSIPTTLAARLVRRLISFRLLSLDELEHALKTAA